MSEHVVPDHLHTAHARGQLVERLAWSVEDAVRVEEESDDGSAAGPPSASYLEVGI